MTYVATTSLRPVIEGQPLLVAAMIAVVFVAGLSTGATGLGFAQLAAVGLSFVVDPKTAVILLAITVPAVSTLQIIRHRASAGEWRSRMTVLFVCCLLGVPIGAFLLTILPVRIIALLLGVFTIAFIFTRLSRPTFGIERRHERALAPVVGIPLPFMSHGGSSMMTNMICIGTLMMIERWSRKPAGAGGLG